MPRIPLVREDDPSAPPEAREVLEEIEEKRGFIVNVWRALANHPQIASATVGLYTTARGGELTPAERELAYTVTSVANSCHY